MIIFSKQATIFNQLKTVLISASALTAYSKFFQETAELENSLPALLFYIKNDVPVSNEEQSSTGSHTRQLTITCSILTGIETLETLETIADNIYTTIYDTVEQGTSDNILMVCNPSLNYKFEDTNNYRVADLAVSILYKV